MRIVTWNLKRAGATSPAFALLRELDPDVAFLQEATSLPPDLLQRYDHILRPTVGKTGAPQRLHAAILARRGWGLRERTPPTQRPWLAAELRRYLGNILCAQVRDGAERLDLIAVHSPAWVMPQGHIDPAHVASIRSPLQPRDIWVTDLVTAVVQEASSVTRRRLVIGGDFNNSETFDHPRPRGNGLWLRQMVEFGFEEALRAQQGRIVPTFRDNRSRQVVHQMDHLFTSREIAAQRLACDVVAPARVFDQGLSDHLPIVADFRP